MRATLIHAARDIRVEDVPDPAVQRPTDALVRVTAACVCGSDLWPYRGVAETSTSRSRIGHEFVGVVEDVGSRGVDAVGPVTSSIAPFALSATTPACTAATACTRRACTAPGGAGRTRTGLPIDAGQGEAVRVPMADGTLVAVPGSATGRTTRCSRALLTLSDVMGTGHHAALSAGVGHGLHRRRRRRRRGGPVRRARRSSARRGARSSPCRGTRTGRRWRATSARPTSSRSGAPDGVAAVEELLGGIGADAVLECVGTKESMQQAIEAARPGGRVGYVGVPAGGSELPIRQLFSSNVAVGGGVAPVRGLPRGAARGRAVRARSTPAGCSTSCCRWRRRPRPTRPWTSGARSRRCCDPDGSAGELAVERGEHRARHGVGVVAAHDRRAGQHLLADARRTIGEHA